MNLFIILSFNQFYIFWSIKCWDMVENVSLSQTPRGHLQWSCLARLKELSSVDGTLHLAF